MNRRPVDRRRPGVASPGLRSLPALVVSTLALLGAACGLVDGSTDAGEPIGLDGDRAGLGADPETGAGVDIGEDPRAGSGEMVEVVRLADGDSGVFAIDGADVEIRLLGYNAPERFEGDGGPESCNGAAAQRALAKLLASASTIEAVGSETDRFGRRLADLLVDGRSVVDLLIADGRGLAIGDDAERRASMATAAAERRGLWGEGCGLARATGLIVDRVEPDPAGRDEDDLNGEIVELVNDGPDAIDLDGWDIRDDSSSHRFDLSGTLGAGQRLVIRTGSGDSGSGELFLGSPSPVWSNRGDSVLVIDPDGVVAAWAFVD